MYSFRNAIQTLSTTFVLLVFFMAVRPQTTVDRPIVVAIPESATTLDTLTSQSSDAASERIRPLLFNSLVKRSLNLDITGELAREIRISKDGSTVTFILRDNVRF